MSVESIQLTPESAQEARQVAAAEATKNGVGAGTAALIKTAVEPPKNTEAPVKPEGVPDKFWDGKAVNYEAWAKSYGELEKKLSQPKTEPKPEPKPGDKPADGEKPKEGAEDKATKTAPAVLDQATYSRYSEEVSKDGKLSEDSYKELAEKFNVSREVADAHIAAVLAKNELNTQKITALAGGQESYEAMIEWAKTSLTTAEQQAFDKTVTTGTEAEVSTAVKGLHALYVQAEGQAPRRVLGGRGGVSVEPFRSSAQLSAAIRDPRYASDPAYRKEVQNRLAVSDIM